MRATIFLFAVTLGEVAFAAPDPAGAKPEASFPSAEEGKPKIAESDAVPRAEPAPARDVPTPEATPPASAEGHAPKVVDPPAFETSPAYATTTPEPPPKNDYEGSASVVLAPPAETERRSPIRFGVQALAGASVKSAEDVRLGLTGHVGVVLSPTLGVLGGLLVNLPANRDFQNTHFFAFEALVDWDPSELLVLSLGPALAVRTISNSLPGRPDRMESSTLAPGFAGRFGFAFGTRRPGQAKNSVFVGVSAHAMFFEDFFFSPLLSVGYERY